MIKKLRQLVLKKVNFSLRKNLNGRCFRIPMLAGLGGAMRRHHEPWMLENLIQIAGEAGGASREPGIETSTKGRSAPPAPKYLYCPFVLVFGGRSLCTYRRRT